MEKKARRHLRALLAGMDTGERNRLTRRAAAMRKAATRAGQTDRRRPRLEDFLAELLGLDPRGPAGDDGRRGSGSPAAAPEPAAGGPTDHAVAEEAAGVIVGLSQGACRVLLGSGRVTTAALPGDLARRQRSGLAVGDEVLVHGGLDATTVTSVLPRRTLLTRADPHVPARRRAIAANVDVVVVVVALQSPPLHPRLIDRYLVAVARSGAQAVLVVNKVDLATPGARIAALAPLQPYRDLGLEVLPCSAATREGLVEVRRVLEGRTCVLVGQSGAGKSSLLNALAGETAAATGAVRAGDGRGRHTTTASALYEIGDGIRVIDTPGIRRFTVEETDAAVLAAGFAEIAAHAGDCRFRDCTHSSEPGCAVRAAADGGAIARARYRSYLKLLAGDGDDPAPLAAQDET